MAYGIVHFFPGGTKEQYEASVGAVHAGDTLPPGQTFHVAGPTDLRTAAPAAQTRFGEYQGLAGLRKGFAAIFGRGDEESGVAEVDFDEFERVRLVVDDQDFGFHGNGPPHGAWTTMVLGLQPGSCPPTTQRLPTGARRP